MSEFKKCSKCLKKKAVEEFVFIKKKSRYASWCNKCTQIAGINSKKKNPNIYKEYSKSYNKNNIFYTMRKNMKISSSKKGFPRVEFGTEYLMELWNNQRGKCYWTGMKMDANHGFRVNPKMVSPDRLAPNTGYVKGNIVLCCIWANLARMQTPVCDWIKFLEELGFNKFDQENLKDERILAK